MLFFLSSFGACKCRKDYEISVRSQIVLNTRPHKENPTNYDMNKYICRKEVSITKIKSQTNSCHPIPFTAEAQHFDRDKNTINDQKNKIAI